MCVQQALLLALQPLLNKRVGMLIRVDARDLKCPMPLLKAKQALRHYPDACGVQVLTSDATANRDFAVFAEHAGLRLVCEEADAFMTLTLYTREV